MSHLYGIQEVQNDLKWALKHAWSLLYASREGSKASKGCAHARTLTNACSVAVVMQQQSRQNLLQVMGLQAAKVIREFAVHDWPSIRTAFNISERGTSVASS